MKTTYLAGRLLVRFNKDADMVLCYHDISKRKWDFSASPAQFDAHIEGLCGDYSVVSLSEILNKENRNKKPRVSITFDDGYQSVYKEAFPIMSKYGVTGTVFLLGDKNSEPKQGEVMKFLTKNQILEMRKSGWEFGYHTYTHKDVTKLNNSELEKEIIRGKQKLESRLGFRLDMFAFPYGRHNRRTVEYIEKAGFTKLFTVKGGKVEHSNNSVFDRITVSRYFRYPDLKLLLTPAGIAIGRAFNSLWWLKDSIK